MIRKVQSILVMLTVLLAVLACNLPLASPTIDRQLLTPEPTFLMPTDGSTLPPVTVTEIPPGPQTFTSTGVKTDYAGNGQQGCDVPTTAELVVNPDGTAQLKTTGPNIIDHNNCVASAEETWYIDGTANTFSQTVAFTTCNFGGFTAKGAITYANQTLLGSVSCFDKDGTQAILLTVGQ